MSSLPLCWWLQNTGYSSEIVYCSHWPLYWLERYKQAEYQYSKGSFLCSGSVLKQHKCLGYQNRRVFTNQRSWSLCLQSVDLGQTLEEWIGRMYRSFHFMKRTVPFSVNINVKKPSINSCVIELLLFCSHCRSPSITSLKKLFSMHRMCLSWVKDLHGYHQQLQIRNMLPISFEIMRRHAILFYKQYSGIYDLQSYDYFTVSAERQRTYSTPSYKFKKWKFNNTFTKTTALLVNVFLNQSEQNSPTVKVCFKQT